MKEVFILPRRRKRRLLVPEAEPKMEKLQMKLLNESMGIHASNREEMKVEVAKQLGIPYNQQGNKEMKAKDAGKMGGAMGGQLVKELVQMSLESLSRKH
ncbi:alpha/beta hydrolase [Thermoflavimicrobium daqui]|jgi:hypothetical protein|uniref:Alpha/beta hydrolase n=1 Tax=Thermoflavimicrobium daqui TaxID=2137476 RepID=A0A364K5K3_9BACL|nr:alpha/beta hydrolase [Thermoflavimicrobium daqui]